MINFDKVKQFKQIYEGWKNMLVPPSEMKALIEQVSKDRLEICEACPKHVSIKTLGSYGAFSGRRRKIKKTNHVGWLL
mgnify:CR=1 FL=1